MNNCSVTVTLASSSACGVSTASPSATPFLPSAWPTMGRSSMWLGEWRSQQQCATPAGLEDCCCLERMTVYHTGDLQVTAVGHLGGSDVCNGAQNFAATLSSTTTGTLQDPLSGVLYELLLSGKLGWFRCEQYATASAEVRTLLLAFFRSGQLDDRVRREPAATLAP